MASKPGESWVCIQQLLKVLPAWDGCSLGQKNEGKVLAVSYCDPDHSRRLLHLGLDHHVFQESDPGDDIGTEQWRTADPIHDPGGYSSFSIAAINSVTKTNLWEACFILQPPGYGLSLRNIRAEHKEMLLIGSLPGLFPGSCLTSSFIQPRSTYSGNGPAYYGIGFPTSVPRRHVHRPAWSRPFLNWGFNFQLTLDYVKLSIKATPGLLNYPG